ncbi:uncharacterized protein J5F26_002776 isoform 1-T9 [Ciconia maguari]
MVGPVHLMMHRAFFYAGYVGKWSLLCLAERGPGQGPLSNGGHITTAFVWETKMFSLCGMPTFLLGFLGILGWDGIHSLQDEDQTLSGGGAGGRRRWPRSCWCVAHVACVAGCFAGRSCHRGCEQSWGLLPACLTTSTLTEVLALSDPRDEAIILPGHVPWGYTMGWVRGAARPRPLAALWLGDVS